MTHQYFTNTVSFKPHNNSIVSILSSSLTGKEIESWGEQSANVGTGKGTIIPLR